MNEKFTITDRFRRLRESLKAGEDVTIGFIGGSITDGSLADTPEKSFADRVVEQMRGDYPDSKIRYINKGVGGTDSVYGCARVGDDLLVHEPDLVIVDFTVNDKDEPIFMESCEGLLRRILKSPSRPAVLVLENIFYDDGHSAEAQHDPLCAHYGLPTVIVREGLYREIQDGKLRMETVTPDGLHPGNFGHERLAQAVYGKLQEVLASSEQTAKQDNKMIENMPDPMTRNRFEKAELRNVRQSGSLSTTMKVDLFEAPYGPAGRPPKFRDGWIGHPGEVFETSFIGSFLAVLYRKTLIRPGCSAVLEIDGQEITLNGEFEKDWGECLYINRILDEDEPSEHHLKLTITGEPDAYPFYLSGLVTA